MCQKEVIVNQIKEIIYLDESKGIQPWELVKNITSEGYLSIETKKINNRIVCNVVFEDDGMFSEKKCECCYQYVYSENMVLLEILSIDDNKFSVVWNRDEELRLTIYKLMKSMKVLSHKDRMNFINDLPIHLKDIILKEYKKIC